MIGEPLKSELALLERHGFSRAINVAKSEAGFSPCCIHLLNFAVSWLCKNGTALAGP